MAQTRRPHRRIIPVKTDAKRKRAKLRSVNAKVPQAKPASTTELATELPDFLFVGNHAFYRTFQITQREVEQQLVYHFCQGAWNIPDLRRLLEEILPKSTSFQDFVVDKIFPLVGHKVLALNGRRLLQEATQPGRILLAMEEVTARQGEG